MDGDAIRIARKRGVSIITAADAGLLGAEDKQHFAYAVEQGYLLITGDIEDYQPILRAWMRQNQQHPGVIYITSKHLKNSPLIAEWLALLSDEPMENRTMWI